MIVAGIERANLETDLLPVTNCFAQAGDEFTVVAERIEQIALQVAVEQRLLIVLAMDFDQLLTERAQLGQRYRPAVDPCPRLTFAANHPAQFAGIVVIKFFGAKPFKDVAAVAYPETGR